MLSRDIVPRPARALRRALLIAGSAGLLLTAQLAAGAAAAGCDSSTTGQRIVLHTRVTAGEEATKPFKNSYGWSIKLTKAYLSVGELYYFDGAPVVAEWSPRRRGGARGFFGIPSAQAHPGHYQEGDAVGQMLTPTTVDLLKETDLPDGDGVTGTYRSARFEFASPPGGKLAGDMDGHVVVLEGEATKGDKTRLFHAALDQEHILNADSNPYVEGCIFDEVEVPADGTVLLTVKPSLWFDQLDFSRVPESMDGKPVDLAEGEIPLKAIARGLQKGTGYTFTYEEDAAREIEGK